MSLADVLLLKPNVQFPNFPYNESFSPSNLEELTARGFDKFRTVYTANKTLVVGGDFDTEEDLDEYILDEFSGIQYNVVTRNDQFDPEYEEQVTDFTIYISKDGAKLLEKYKSITEKLRSDEIAVFLEVPSGDKFSNKVLLVEAGANAEKYVESLLRSEYLSGKYELKDSQVDFLLKSLGEEPWDFFTALVETVAEVSDYVVDKVLDIGIEVFDAIAGFFGETLRFDEKFWNSDHPQYEVGFFQDVIISTIRSNAKDIDDFAKKYNSVLPEPFVALLKAVGVLADGYASLLDTISVVVESIVAFICGIWNAIMDLISGIFDLVKLILQAIKGVSNVVSAGFAFATNQDYYRALLAEYLDNMVQAIQRIDLKEVFEKGKEFLNDLMSSLKDIPTKLMNSLSEINHTEIAYYVGYIIVQILEFIFPPLHFAKLGNIGRLGKLSKVLDVFGDIGSQNRKLMKTAKRGGKRAIHAIFDFFKAFIDELRKGTKSFIKFLEEIFTNLRKAINELFGLGITANRANINEYIKLYPKLIKRGSNKARSKYDSALKKIDSKLKKKKFKSERHKTFARSKLKGDEAEEIIEKVLKGKRPGDPKSFKTSLCRRFPDNFFKGILREVKAGNLTMRYRKQILKDLEIVKNPLSTIGGVRVSKIEWHVFGEVDELVLKFIQRELKDQKISPDKFIVIIH